MKKQISTLVYLFLSVSLLNIPHSRGQTDTRPKPTSKRQQPENRRELAKTQLQNLADWGKKNKINTGPANSPKQVPDIAATIRSSKPIRRSDVQHARILPKDSLKMRWMQKAGISLKRQKPAARRQSPVARKSATAAGLAILFVNKDAGEGGDGSTWENAFTELANALYYAKEHPEVEQIWVAAGIYHPLYDHNYLTEGEDYTFRDNVFLMLPNVKIYGGFAGVENSVAERDLRLSEGVAVSGDYSTILSGDLFDDDGDTGDRSNNVYHVVMSAGNVGEAILDGFTITGGNALGLEAAEVNNQLIRRNVGAGIVAFNSSPSLSNLFFIDNEARSGSAIYGAASDFVLTNALMGFNYSRDSGTVYINQSAPVITNATITENAADIGGGIVFSGTGTSAMVRNSIVYGNGASANPSIFADQDATPSFAYSLIQGSGGSGTWQPGYGTDQGFNLDTDPLFEYGSPGLQAVSPAVNAGNNVYFNAGQSPELSGFTIDQRGTERITGTTVDMGALESLYGNLSSDLFPNSEGVLFVKKGGAGEKNGSSWDNAAPEVADALFAGVLNPEISEIWVAGGTYHPLYRPDNLSNADLKSNYNSFLLVDGISLYGGFAGTEATRAQRDLTITENASILSGDFEGDDAFDFEEIMENLDSNPRSDENAYHLVTAAALEDYGAALDGFTIEGAHSLYSDVEETLRIKEIDIPTSLGAGIVVANGNPLLENLVIRNNIGIVGGGLTLANAGVVITNSTMYHNVDPLAGSAVAILGAGFGQLIMINTTVAQNLSLQNGPAVRTFSAFVAIGNSIIYNNIFSEDSPDLAGNTPNPDFSCFGTFGVIANSMIGSSGGSADWQLKNPQIGLAIEDGGDNLDEDPAFNDVNALDFSLSACSKAIDAGDAEFYDEGTFPFTDLAGNPRLINEKLDMGALEYQDVRPASATALAANGTTSSFVFEENTPHTFSVDGEVCESDLLTLAPEILGGEVTAKVWVDDEVQSFNGAVYLQRHFDIIPANNADVSTARVVLYFTQAEFNALNAQLTAPAYLPTGIEEGEEDRKANLRIFQFHGVSSDDSGAPSSYGDSRAVINPEDEDIKWNAGLNRWEIAFFVEGFSGFFAGTASENPLPVHLVSFEGKRTDEHATKLEWKVVEQVGIDAYQVEYSRNGKSFGKIGQITANTLSNTDYAFTDTLTHSGDRAYYRLKVIEMDGKTAFSKIISVKLPAQGGLVAYPVPARNELWIDWKKTDAAFVEFVDLNGKTFKTVNRASAKQKVDISALPTGLFLLKATGGTVLKVLKE